MRLQQDQFSVRLAVGDEDIKQGVYISDAHINFPLLNPRSRKDRTEPYAELELHGSINLGRGEKEWHLIESIPLKEAECKKNLFYYLPSVDEVEKICAVVMRKYGGLSVKELKQFVPIMRLGHADLPILLEPAD